MEGKTMITLLLTLLTFSPANEYLDGVQLSVQANYHDAVLPLTSDGIITKKVGIGRVKVAVLEYFSQYPDKFIRSDSGAVASTNNTGVNAITITFVRTVEGSQIVDLINDYLNSNFTQEEQTKYAPNIKQITEAISSDAEIYDGKTITFVLDTNNVVYYSNTSNNITTINSIDSNFNSKIMSLFLGNCPDNDCERLKSQLLQVPQVTKQ